MALHTPQVSKSVASTALAMGTLIASLAGVGVLASSALFTDTAQASNTFTTGTLDINSNPSTTFTVSNMAPGDFSFAGLTAINAGTLQLRYAVSSVSTNADNKGLAAAMQIGIKVVPSTCDATSYAASSTTVYSGSLSGLAVGSPTSGAQAGDRVLNGGASEVLCVRAELPIGTGNSVQGATTSSTWTLNAEQTANN